LSVLKTYKASRLLVFLFELRLSGRIADPKFYAGIHKVCLVGCIDQKVGTLVAEASVDKSKMAKKAVSGQARRQRLRGTLGEVPYI